MAPCPAANRDDAHHLLGLPDATWSLHRALAIESLCEMEPNDQRHKAVPHSFSHAFPEDKYVNNDGSGHVSSSFGYPSAVFKVMNRDDCHLCCLYRLDNVRFASHKVAAAITEKPNRIMVSASGARLIEHHPGICHFYR